METIILHHYTLNTLNIIVKMAVSYFNWCILKFKDLFIFLDAVRHNFKTEHNIEYIVAKTIKEYLKHSKSRLNYHSRKNPT